jgi:hypothetical protein
MSSARPPKPVFFLLALALTAVALASGCTLLWIFQNDPDGLPCEVDEDGNGRCLEGYTCVPRGEDALPVCLRAGAKKLGEPCTIADECDRDLTCGTGYAVCATDPDDPNCSLVADAEKQLACRPICDVNSAETCGINQLCFQGETTGFCQVGICGTDSDCQTIRGAEGFCVGEARLGGKTGFCFEGCNPLACAGGICPDCTGVDGQPDPDTNCVNVIDDGFLSARTMCDTNGTVPAFAPCDPFGEPCVHGSFCNAFVSGRAPFCSPWCRFPNAAPACNSPAVCRRVEQERDLGFCVVP